MPNEDILQIYIEHQRMGNLALIEFLEYKSLVTNHLYI
ncbi:hypothetical protein BPO_0743 [Bergeyella porcorum]|uniref:Uncharacterized protein n=1 Tax=Bergeyella porcorum TaxID=1735111 RepID=A0AAU0F029_9FLAO